MSAIILLLCLSVTGCGKQNSETEIDLSECAGMTGPEVEAYLAQYGYTIEDLLNGNVPLTGSWSTIPSTDEDRILIKTEDGYLILRDGELIEVDKEQIPSEFQ